MSSTRDQLLNLLKARSQVSVTELAEALSVSAVSVRHHLSSLQAEGLVNSTEVRRTVGRPHLVYSLTEAAQERFPAKYLRLSDRLLDELKATLPPHALEEMFTHMAEGMVADYRDRLAGRPLEDKLTVLIELLGTEGFMARWNRTGETISLMEYNCPYVYLGQRHPEVCSIDQTVIREALQVDVEKTNCILTGAEHCEFVIRANRPVTIPADTLLPNA